MSEKLLLGTFGWRHHGPPISSRTPLAKTSLATACNIGRWLETFFLNSMIWNTTTSYLFILRERFEGLFLLRGDEVDHPESSGDLILLDFVLKDFCKLLVLARIMERKEFNRMSSNFLIGYPAWGSYALMCSPCADHLLPLF